MTGTKEGGMLISRPVALKSDTTQDTHLGGAAGQTPVHRCRGQLKAPPTSNPGPGGPGRSLGPGWDARPRRSTYLRAAPPPSGRERPRPPAPPRPPAAPWARPPAEPLSPGLRPAAAPPPRPRGAPRASRAAPRPPRCAAAPAAAAGRPPGPAPRWPPPPSGSAAPGCKAPPQRRPRARPPARPPCSPRHSPPPPRPRRVLPGPAGRPQERPGRQGPAHAPHARAPRPGQRRPQRQPGREAPQRRAGGTELVLGTRPVAVRGAHTAAEALRPGGTVRGGGGRARTASGSGRGGAAFPGRRAALPAGGGCRGVDRRAGRAAAAAAAAAGTGRRVGLPCSGGGSGARAEPRGRGGCPGAAGAGQRPGGGAEAERAGQRWARSRDPPARVLPSPGDAAPAPCEEAAVSVGGAEHGPRWPPHGRLRARREEPVRQSAAGVAVAVSAPGRGERGLGAAEF